MYRTNWSASQIYGGNNRSLNSLLLVTGVFAVLSLFALVAGPVLTGRSIGASPSHSHVFLTSEAATGHSHANESASALESEVVNLGSQSADSAPGSVHLLGVTQSSDSVRLTTSIHAAAPDPDYSDPFSTAPELPPRLT